MSTIKKTLTIEQEETFRGLTFLFRMSAGVGEVPTVVDFSLKNPDGEQANVSGSAYTDGQINVSIQGKTVPDMTGVSEAVEKAKQLATTPVNV